MVLLLVASGTGTHLWREQLSSSYSIGQWVASPGEGTERSVICIGMFFDLDEIIV